MNSQPRRARRASPRGRALHTQVFPDSAGVYSFLGRSKKPLYIGRATSLRTRVRSYFADSTLENPSTSLGARRSPWIAQMLERAKSVEYQKTASILEAILLEADLIKKWKPPYNTKEKDDKSFNCIAMTDEEFPRVLLVRGVPHNSFSAHLVQNTPIFLLKNRLVFASSRSKGSSQGAHSTSCAVRNIFGPFPHSAHVRDALKIIRKIFPYRDTCVPPLRGVPKAGDVKPCFNRQIGLCPGVCTGEISAKEYRKHIARLAMFLSGKTRRVQKTLDREMKRAARAQEFEKAGELKRQLFSLRHIQDIALLKNPPLTPLLYELPSGLEKGGGGGGFWKSNGGMRIEAYDISHFGGKGIVGAFAVVVGGIAQPSEYRLFKIKSVATQNDVAALAEVLARRLAHPEWPLPHLVVVDGGVAQKRAAERVLIAADKKINVVAVVKDERHKPREILGLYEHSNIHRNVGISWRDVERAIFLANAEAHRFVLRFQKQGRYTRG